MPALSIFTFLDFSNEKSTFSVFNDAITAVSLPGFLTQFGALRTALEGVTLGVVQQEQWVGDRTVISNTPPTDPFAQRELKWLVGYTNPASGKLFTVEVPTADPTGRLVAGTDLADLNEAAMAAFVTAFENLVSPPDDQAGAVNVEYVRLVGRNI